MTQISTSTEEMLHHFTVTVPLIPKLNAPAATTPPAKLNAPAATTPPAKLNAPAATTPPAKLNAPAATTPPAKLNAPAATTPPAKLNAPAATTPPAKLNAPAATTPPAKLNAPAATTPPAKLNAPAATTPPAKLNAPAATTPPAKLNAHTNNTNRTADQPGQKSAKGLEFPIVALAGFVENNWQAPMSASVSGEEREESIELERRTMFVGMTRAICALLVVVPERVRSPLLSGFDENYWNLEE